MKFKTKQATLNKALNIVSRIAGGAHSTLPILSNVLIRVSQKKVEFITTNLDMAVQTYIPIKDGEEGSITAPAKLLAEFINNLPSESEVEVVTEGAKVKISAGSYESVINGVEAGDFPEMPDIDEKSALRFELSGDEFKTGVGQIIVACSNDFARPALTGVFFNTFEEALYIAATDGYRLAELRFAEKVEDKVEVIVPSSSLREVLNVLGDSESIEILFDESQVRFRLNDTEITSKLIEGTFPNYRALLPQNIDLDIELDKAEMLRITKIAALFARQSSGTIVCRANAEKGEFSVAAVANEMGENDSTLSTKVEKDAKVNLNSRYLLDALNALTEKKICFGFSKVNSLEPILLKNAKSDEYRHIIMPMAGDTNE